VGAEIEGPLDNGVAKILSATLLNSPLELVEPPNIFV
jgi:hypothetical protein